MVSSYDLENPALIYEGPRKGVTQPLAPLILVHDGGGTTFSYHCLEPINRPLYGIQNARLHEGGWWEGGIPQMANHYITLLSKSMPGGGDILLGGWSLGGLLSLEMAHQLATAPSHTRKFRVLGMVFIDSVYPRHLAEERMVALPLPSEPTVKTLEEMEAMKLKEKVDLNMMHARMMVRHWDLPKWEGIAAPPTILLRAKERVESESQVFVDHNREELMLGWEKYNAEHGNFIKEVVEVEGHHFSIFEFDRIPDVTEKIRLAADALDWREF
ncbi:hypothetical protein DL764_003755 [Monosporascus ibericus]|uniref:Thioesterase domain-containing protein n=1 Tax=Monosporascus ibericus TaxID=155417 RepID=A0A4Q4TFB2_9PEZI|nr:hypothetical protein DL764_003755 [Monosporascus ibericus]